MHNAALEAAGLPFVYLAFAVPPARLGSALAGLGSLGVRGVNLTIPHKEAALSLLDEVAPEALALGAVNTVQVGSGRLVGHNTDVHGFLEPLRLAGIDISGCRAVVVGAGGAARAVVYGLVRSGATVTVSNRTSPRAVALAEVVRQMTGRDCVDVVGSGSDELRTALREASLLVNTTSVGMDPHPEAIPDVPIDCLHAGMTVYDLVYRPAETRLLRMARAAGCSVLNGEQMLVQQGAQSFRIWLDQEPDVERMLLAVASALGADRVSGGPHLSVAAEGPV